MGTQISVRGRVLKLVSAMPQPDHPRYPCGADGVVPGSTRPGRVGVLEFEREVISADQFWVVKDGINVRLVNGSMGHRLVMMLVVVMARPGPFNFAVVAVGTRRQQRMR